MSIYKLESISKLEKKDKLVFNVSLSRNGKKVFVKYFKKRITPAPIGLRLFPFIYFVHWLLSSWIQIISQTELSISIDEHIIDHMAPALGYR